MEDKPIDAVEKICIFLESITYAFEFVVLRISTKFSGQAATFIHLYVLCFIKKYMKETF